MNDKSFLNNIDFEKYKNILSIKNIKAGTLLFSEGDECNTLGILISGEIKISTLTALGKEYIIKVLHENDTFGDTLLFSEQNTYLGDGITTKDCKILYISKASLLILLQDPTILESYLTMLAAKSSRINERLKLFSQKSIEDRVIFYLTLECKRLNSNIIPITSKETLANILNIPRPSLSRELINLKNKKIIEYNKKHITLLKD
ncbi:MAG: Crp/Fnr family transcriptional regulator [Acholeplasmatales bacterium]|nr:Crp/Fnr family transcriptional regulator [Acholeplasmatales bacterium]